MAQQMERQRRQPVGVSDDDLCKRIIARACQLGVGESVQCCDRLSSQTGADSGVLDGCPADKLGDIEHGQIALLVSLSRRDCLSVVRLDHVIPLDHWSDFDRTPPVRTACQRR